MDFSRLGRFIMVCFLVYNWLDTNAYLRLLYRRRYIDRLDHSSYKLTVTGFVFLRKCFNYILVRKYGVYTTFLYDITFFWLEVLLITKRVYLATLVFIRIFYYLVKPKETGGLLRAYLNTTFFYAVIAGEGITDESAWQYFSDSPVYHRQFYVAVVLQYVARGLEELELIRNIF